MLDIDVQHVEAERTLSEFQQSTQLTILAVATQGDNSHDADRLRALLSQLPYEMFPFHRHGKRRAFVDLAGKVWRDRPDLVVLEGTGLAGGLAVLLARLAGRSRYVVSTGDAIGPYVRKFHPVIGLAFSLYERVLYRFCAGFIGWTPYLVGRALTFGAPYAMTAAGWAPFERTGQELNEARQRIRRKLGIGSTDIVVGIVGSLNWNARVGYCYGYELVKALLASDRRDVHVLIVGDGDGRPVLEQLAGSQLGSRIHLTGRVNRDVVPDYLAAMDVASLPQSIDQVGSFRYTTKISEYMSVGLPIVTGHLPLAYDFPTDLFWRLPGDTPWGETYIAALSEWMSAVSARDVKRRCAEQATHLAMFDRQSQTEQVTCFVRDLLDSRDFVRNGIRK